MREQISRCAEPLSAQDKTHIVTELAEVLAQQPDAIVRREWAKYVAEHLGVDEQLVLARARTPQTQKSFAPTSQKPVAAPQSPVNPAEEELLAWLLRAPQYAAFCAELTEQDFSTPGAHALFHAVYQAAQNGATAQNIVEQAGASVPSLAQELVKLALVPTPPDFEPQRDISAGVARVQQNGVQKRLKEVQRQMKALGAGNVPPEMIQEFMLLQTKLKK